MCRKTVAVHVVCCTDEQDGGIYTLFEVKFDPIVELTQADGAEAAAELRPVHAMELLSFMAQCK